MMRPATAGNDHRSCAQRALRASTRGSGLLALALACLLMLGVATADANSPAVAKIMERCKNGQSLEGFSEKAYHEALHQMGADNVEYSNCSELIVEAELAAASHGHRGGSHGKGGGGAAGGGGGAGGGTTGGSGGSSAAGGTSAGGAPAPRTPEQEQTLTHAQQAPPAPAKLGGGPKATPVEPGVVHANVSSALNSLPVPLIAAIAAVAALIALLLGRELRDRLRVADEEA